MHEVRSMHQQKRCDLFFLYVGSPKTCAQLTLSLLLFPPWCTVQAAILYNLKLRHVREKPYTRTGDIVIATNPYKWFHELYTEEKRTYYSNRLVWDRSEEDPRAVMEPHVYEVSSLSYKGLAFGENEDQSILVSGESGAGYVFWGCQMVSFFACVVIKIGRSHKRHFPLLLLISVQKN
jgi:Myosin head (motor domain)